MASTHKYQIPLQNLSIQATHAEIFTYLHSSLISIGQLCDNECIVTCDKHKEIVSKNKDIIIEGYLKPTNGLWRFPLHHLDQKNKQSNMLYHTYSTTLDQWRHGNPYHIAHYTSKT